MLLMSQMTDQAPAETSNVTDLVTAVQQVLQNSDEPLTPSKIRAALPSRLRGLGLDELTDVLHRQVAANVLYQYPRYRGQHDRFWDRPMDVHVTMLLRAVLEEGPLPWSELRRKLPSYAQDKAEPILTGQVEEGAIHRHPRTGRTGERYGVRPADPQDYLRPELGALIRRLTQLGFSETQLREAALQVLHDDEWSPAQTPPRSREAAGEDRSQAASRPPHAEAQPSPGQAAAGMRPQTVPESEGPHRPEPAAPSSGAATNSGQ
jgi:hypothetical protein